MLRRSIMAVTGKLPDQSDFRRTTVYRRQGEGAGLPVTRVIINGNRRMRASSD